MDRAGLWWKGTVLHPGQSVFLKLVNIFIGLMFCLL